jgi:hypothetical protein
MAAEGRRRMTSADLESGLGSRPHEFESRILRCSDLTRGKTDLVVRFRMVRTGRSLSFGLTCR